MKSSRRDFLAVAGTSTLVSLSPSVPQFLVQAAARESSSTEESILIVIQMSGGNDGLNTVVPYADDAYYKNRFTLAIGRDQVHKIDDSLGFHPSLKGYSQLLEDGKLAVVQGVGYPNPNRSHFESMDLWHTAHRSSASQQAGWLGRSLDASDLRDGRDVVALHLGREKQPLALSADRVSVPSIQALDKFRLETGGDQQLARVIQGVAEVERGETNELLSFIQQSTTSALSVSRRVERAAKKYRTDVDYPPTGLAHKLRTVAQLIDAGLSTRVYYLTLAGFDTHSKQATAHAGLLRQLGDATKSFLEDLGTRGHSDRVLMMTFSEFGRRVKENASHGTDHGAAAPVFLAGGKVKAGLVGEHPSLMDLHDGDLKFHTDYRRIYATVLESWLGWESESILGQRFEPLDAVT